MRTLLVIAVLALAVQAPARSASAQTVMAGVYVRTALETALSQMDDTDVDHESLTLRKNMAVAYGTGVTTCTFTVNRHFRPAAWTEWAFAGTTDCSAVVQQTGRATMTGASPAVAGPLCSGVRAACRSDGDASGTYSDVSYRVTLVAPLGQGWVASPHECAGVGTDRLDCTF